MPIFISYSNADSAFVDWLAESLVNQDTHVWVDRWELSVGDSILEKVQEAIDRSSALLIVLSNTSVQSSWCKKELSAGLLRELEEKRVVVLPVMLEDCAVPIFLRDKVYADFRSDYQLGLQALLKATRLITNVQQGTIEGEIGRLDWHERLVTSGSPNANYDAAIVHSRPNWSYKVLVTLYAVLDPTLTQGFREMKTRGIDWLAPRVFRRALIRHFELLSQKLVIQDELDNMSFRTAVTFETPDSRADLRVDIKRVGRVDNSATIVDLRRLLQELSDEIDSIAGAPSENQLRQIRLAFGAADA